MQNMHKTDVKLQTTDVQQPKCFGKLPKIDVQQAKYVVKPPKTRHKKHPKSEIKENPL